jgi:hypothetical protein
LKEKNMTTTDVVDGLADECRVDHVGLWEVVKAAHFDLGALGPAEIRATTIDLVRCLLERGILVGFPAPGGRDFVSWNLSPEAAVYRIEQEWCRLGREPNIGEVAWFTAPD